MTESALKTDYDDTRTEAASSVGDQDDLILKKMGYKPTLHRGLGAVMNFAFGFVEVAVLASICLTYPVGLATGGPVVIFWGFVANFFFVMIIAHCMAEICGAYPSAGSVYHWAGQLASKDHAPIWSYITGWLNFLGNGAGDASFANGFASTFSAGIVASGGQALSNGQIVGVSIAILFLWSLLNCLRIDSVGGINYFAAFFQFGSIFVVFFALIFANQHGFSSRTYVFSFFEDKTYTPPVDTVYATFNITNSTNTTMTYEPTSQDTAAHFSKSYIIAAGLTTALFSFAGYEASAHMAEETHNCSENAPNGIINTCWATGIGGLFVLFGLLFAYDVSTVDDGLLAGTGSVIVDIFLYTCGSTWGQALAWIVTINYFLAGVSSVTVTGRITYALCRDGGFPFREWLEVVNPFTKSPIRAVMFVFLFDSVFLLLPLNPNAALAFYAIVGLSTFGFQASYGIPILLKLIYPQANFPQTKHNLGIFSFPLGIISCIWLFAPITLNNMNWLAVVVCGVLAIMAVNWIVSGRYTFKGPKRPDWSDDSKSVDAAGTTEKTNLSNSVHSNTNIYAPLADP